MDADLKDRGIDMHQIIDTINRGKYPQNRVSVSINGRSQTWAVLGVWKRPRSAVTFTPPPPCEGTASSSHIHCQYWAFRSMCLAPYTTSVPRRL
eukprot:3437422-Rhodomonas_salina.1